jgi:hypothetical protein
MEELEEMDKVCWNEPSNHALVKENLNGMEFYSIFTLNPKLMMKLCDDLGYAKRLADKMLKSGVRVFDNFDTFYNWYKHSKDNLPNAT